jgi:histidyl-tRNA synthetase
MRSLSKLRVGIVHASNLPFLNRAASSRSTAMSKKPPRGTRDFLPDDMYRRQWLFQQWREVALLYGFEEYDAPVLENADLYTRKAGEEVVDQLYVFDDKGGRQVALRPEMTPSLARVGRPTIACL